MTHTFTDALALVLKEEGGFSDNARDPGGMTNLGVTARTWASWSGGSATESVMRALTPGQVAPLYQTDYWNKIKGDNLPDGVNLVVFDFAVNSGPGNAAKTLQAVVGATADGIIGPDTLAAVTAHDAKELITAYSNSRASFYRSLATFATFGKGWLARVDRIEEEALSWVG